MNGLLVNIGASTETHPYTIGSTVDLIFQTDDASSILIGNTISVQLIDAFGNLIDTMTAIKASDGQPIYLTEYTIPFNITSRYNIGNIDIGAMNPGILFLTDRWIFPDLSYQEFPFLVNREIPQAVTDNAEFYVTLDGIEASDNSIMAHTEIHFTTHLNPCYCSVQDVQDVFRKELLRVDKFLIARDIVGIAKVIDLHIKPNIEYVKYPERMASAMHNYSIYLTAWKILNMYLSTIQEEKGLDTFRVSRTTSNEALLKLLKDWMDTYERIIWAGGRDTPFVSKNFEKGLFDPNRPNLARSNLDISGWYPYVNSSSDSSLMLLDDGTSVEVRGTRDISFSHINNKYFKYDKGDVGYMSGI